MKKRQLKKIYDDLSAEYFLDQLAETNECVLTSNMLRGLTQKYSRSQFAEILEYLSARLFLSKYTNHDKEASFYILKKSMSSSAPCVLTIQTNK